MTRRGPASLPLAGALAAILVLAGGAALAAPTYQWTDQHDGGGNFNDDGYAVLTDPDGHVVVGGESTDSVGADLLLRKLHKDTGAEIWSQRYVGFDDKDVALSEMTWDSVGQLIVAGFIRGCVG